MQPTTFRSRKFDFQSHQGSFHVKAFNEFWPAYKTWYESKKHDAADPIRLKEAETQLSRMMPELLPIYAGFREVSNDCPIAASFLTGYQPPAYLVNCSQAVFTDKKPLLIRNYDLSIRSATPSRIVQKASLSLRLDAIKASLTSPPSILSNNA